MEGPVDDVPQQDFTATTDESNTTRATTKIRMLEFFSGIGGMRISIEKALNLLNNQKGNQQRYILESCRAYDISLHANNVYHHNFCGDDKDGHSVCTKLVEQLKPKDILPLRANLWTMSPPCQPFTTNGEGRGKQRLDATDKRCNGLKGIAKLLSAFEKRNRPKWILLENVKGFAESAMCEIWCECLRDNGYSYRPFVLSPVEFGIPNHRTRFYLLAELDSERWSHDDEDSEVCNSKASVAHGISSLTFYREIAKRPVHKVARYVMDVSSLDPYLVPMKVLLKAWSKGLGIVSKNDKATHCFTAGYGRIYHRSTGSLLLIPGYKADLERHGEALEALPLDRSDMTVYENQLRRFQPKELLCLLGFVQVDREYDEATAFEIPSSVVPSLEQRYKLIGNSISVNVVTELLLELLLSA
eukprot:CAMPEP_0116156850 /NCGR_PEP_ID=MMETSP0329-20121206/23042_1 /TAXON_ID=697910 /ORGANISM="Pseudo-nitzschia arenysensis, Strain B593" /LENGTH=414 /DNA_ID=CAMNT_0003653941 /DNA_START=117 /DNA_END=1361 /DNA_ORIENTATION=+